MNSTKTKELRKLALAKWSFTPEPKLPFKTYWRSIKRNYTTRART